MMKNPLLDDIKKHKQAYLTAEIASEVIERRYLIKLSEDEIAYFALHFYVALERHKVTINRKKYCWFVLPIMGPQNYYSLDSNKNLIHS
jgi:transcriptional antiterminator